MRIVCFEVRITVCFLFAFGAGIDEAGALF